MNHTMQDKLKQAKEYLGSKHVLAKNSTYQRKWSDAPFVLSEWLFQRQLEKVK